MFLFRTMDNERSAFISKDPIFSSVEGLQLSTGFLTKEMVEYMKAKLVKKNPGDLACYENVKYPLNEEAAGDLIYNFSEFMEECSGGEKADATVSVQMYF